MVGRYNLKQALALAPMELCALKHKNPSREWWRYGWAWGFMERSLLDALAPVREKRYRDALSIGYAVGSTSRRELVASGVGGA